MKIGVIGTGHMGEPIMSGIASKLFDQASLMIHNRSVEHSERSLAAAKAASEGKVTIEIAESNSSLCEKSDVIIIGVRPQAMDSLMEDIKSVSFKEKLVISLAAGIKLDYYTSHLGDETKVVLAMPNQPSRYDMGLASLCRNDKVDDEAFGVAKMIFQTVGQVMELEEKDLDTFTGISSSTAFVHYYAGALIKAAVANGMSDAKARMAVAQAAKGGLEMILQSDTDIDEMIASSTTEGGTTIEGIKVFRESGADEILAKALQASIDRAKELGAK